ncbi:MAG: TolC family protein [Saprospiraceae bacterium]|nr:TolC family protein [Saprospiraceae bacterium]
MNVIYNILKLTTLSLCLAQLANAQNFDQLIISSWDNNAQLKSKNFELRQAELALSESKRMYGPTVSFQTQYTLASGGRLIELPVGDLVNPAYNALNILTQSNNFPMIQNEEIYFLPNNFYDSRFSIKQPIYYPELSINKELKKEQVTLKQLEIKAFKRFLSKEVMQAYIRYQSLQKMVQIIVNADTLLMETAKITDRMLKNGITVPAAAYRIKAEMAALERQKTEVSGNLENAHDYLKFLTGKDELSDFTKLQMLNEMPDLSTSTEDKREEILQLEQALKMNQLALKKEDMYYQPKLGLGLDVGSQDFDFGWSPYVLMGLNLEINLFDSGRHKKRKEQVNAEITSRESQKQYAEDQFQLQKKMALTQLNSSLKQYENYKPTLENARKLYKDVSVRYKEGTANYLEITDASKNLTQTELEYSILKDMVWQKWAEYIYATAAYPIQ